MLYLAPSSFNSGEANKTDRLNKICETEGIDKSRLYFFDDSLNNCTDALNAGFINTIRVTPGDNKEKILQEGITTALEKHAQPVIQERNHSFLLKSYLKIGLAIFAGVVALSGVLLMGLALASLTAGIGPLALASAAMVTAGFVTGAQLLSPITAALGGIMAVAASGIIALLIKPKISQGISFFNQCNSSRSEVDTTQNCLH